MELFYIGIAIVLSDSLDCFYCILLCQGCLCMRRGGLAGMCDGLVGSRPVPPCDIPKEFGL